MKEIAGLDYGAIAVENRGRMLQCYPIARGSSQFGLPFERQK